MNMNSRGIRGLLLAATVAIVVGAVPATAASADADAGRAILKARAIL